MEEKGKDSRILYLIIGLLLTMVIFLAGGKLREINPFGLAKFEFPTETPFAQPTAIITQQFTQQAAVSTVPPNILQTPPIIAPSTATNTPATFPPPCSGFVSRNTVIEWSVVGETGDKEKVKNYLQKFYKVFFESSGPKPVEFHGGDIIPAGRIVATDFGGFGETEVWKNYPLQSVAHYRSWGLFETTNDFYVPTGGGGQCLVIVP